MLNKPLPIVDWPTLRIVFLGSLTLAAQGLGLIDLSRWLSETQISIVYWVVGLSAAWQWVRQR